MKDKFLSFFIILILLNGININAQPIIEKTAFRLVDNTGLRLQSSGGVINGHEIKTYTEDLKLVRSEKYLDNTVIDPRTGYPTIHSNSNLVEVININPNNGFLEGENMDGVNTYIYDSLSRRSTENLIIPMIIPSGSNGTSQYFFAQHFHRNDWKYDEIYIHNLKLENEKLSGKGYIIGYKYDKKENYDPISGYMINQYHRELYITGNRLNWGERGNTYYGGFRKELNVVRQDTIGTFNMIDGQYTGRARLNYNGETTLIEFNEYGTPISYTQLHTDGTESQFNVGSKYYKIKGELFFSPSIEPNNHSFKKITEVYNQNSFDRVQKIKEKNNSIRIKKYAKYPFISFDILRGNIGIANKDILESDQIMRLYFYDTTGIFYTEILDGHRLIYDEGRIIESFKDSETNKIIPKYYWKINCYPFYNGFDEPITSTVPSSNGLSCNWEKPDFKNVPIRRKLSFLLDNVSGSSGLLFDLNGNLKFKYKERGASDPIIVSIGETESRIGSYLDARIYIKKNHYSEYELRNAANKYGLTKEKLTLYPSYCTTSQYALGYYYVLCTYEDGQLTVHTREDIKVVVDDWVSKKMKSFKVRKAIEKLKSFDYRDAMYIELFNEHHPNF